ncbi:MAG: hypothetical protein WC788_01130 [Candidatus Paceibacterota bacterium]|jgi:hypothetical protein
MENKKKLFYWDFARIIVLFFIFYPVFGGAEIDQADLSGWAIETGISELLTNDGHVWGDIPWILFNIDFRGQIWIFAQPVIVALSFLWAYKNSVIAKRLRIANWFIALCLYAGWTIFYPTTPKYDYFIFAYVLSQTGWPPILLVSFLISILMMWAGVVLVSGYYIYKSLLDEKNGLEKIIPLAMSMGIPGTGHFAVGKRRRGAIFLFMGSLVWAIDFYLFFITPLAFIPTLLFWAYSAYDVNRPEKSMRKSNGLRER